MENGTAVVEQKKVSIDLFLSDNPQDNAIRAAILRGSTDYKALDSADAIVTAIKQGLSPGLYKAEKREDRWYFTPQPLPSSPSR